MLYPRRYRHDHYRERPAARAANRWSVGIRVPLLLVLLSLLVFGGLVETAGLIIATVGLSLVAAAGSRETRWLETTFASLVLATVSALVFVKGLGLTIKILPGM